MKRGRKIQLGILVLIIILIWALANYYSLMNPNIELQEPKIVFVEEEPKIIEIIEGPEEKIEPVPVNPVTMISELECVDGSINMLLTNIGKEESRLSDFIIMVSARINNDPDCGVVTLKPGEATQCLNIGRIKMKGKKQVIVRNKGVSESDIVAC